MAFFALTPGLVIPLGARRVLCVSGHQNELTEKAGCKAIKRPGKAICMYGRVEVEGNCLLVRGSEER